VDARSGVVYEGVMSMMTGQPQMMTSATSLSSLAGGIVESIPVTATKIYMNLGVPEKIEEYKGLPFEGIVQRVEGWRKIRDC